MTKEPTKDQAFTKVVKVLRDSFGPGVDFELFKESDKVYRVRATAKDDASIEGGLEKMRAARLRSDTEDISVTMISADDAKEYRSRAASATDPLLKAGYEVLAREALGQ